MSGSLNPSLPEIGTPNSTADPKIRESLIALRDGVNGLLAGTGENKIPKASLEAEAAPVTWYAPKVIATEESTASTSFVTLTTADQIPSVVVPTSGKLVVAYQALAKSSVANAGKIAIFIGSNQLKVAERNGVPIGNEGTVRGTFFSLTGTGTEGFALSGNSESSDSSLVTTGMPIVSTEITVAPGTYNISVKYRATSGTVTAKERKLWTEVRGF